MCYNMYDVRLHDDSCGVKWPPDLADVTPYLRRDDVKKALHITRDHENGWQECNGHVSSGFANQKSIPSVRFLPELLSQLRIVLFSGDKDLICNHIGTEEIIHNLEFNNGKGFETSPGVWAPRRSWTFDGELTGFYQEARNLTYVLFYNSSHMVPFDLARQSRDMLDRFMGVDVSSIGGKPANSLIDGEPARPPTHPAAANESWADPAAGNAAIDEAVQTAYRKSGEVVLVLVALAAVAWGFFVCRARRRRSGYRGIWSGADDGDELEEGLQLNGVKRVETRTLDAAREYDERILSDDEDEEGEESGQAFERLRGESSGGEKS
jgi:carboxypeptidase D